ncbi:MAG: NlpC/P60 family protein, partial [Solirubrobacteraceae bacterium]
GGTPPSGSGGVTTSDPAVGTAGNSGGGVTPAPSNGTTGVTSTGDTSGGTTSETAGATTTGGTTGGTTSTTTGGGAHPSQPTTKAQCMNGGYVGYGFKNQGQCIDVVVHKSPQPGKP